MSIGTSINNVAGKGFNAIANTKFIKKSLNKGLADPAAFAASMLVTSIVSKDLVGCFLYTTQSLNNKKIPEENRKFVAMIDLVNGALMVGGQFLVGKLIDGKIIPKLQESSTKKYFSEDKFTKIATNAVDSTKDAIKAAGVNLDNKSKEKVVKNIVEGLNKTRKSPYLTGLSIVTTALLTTALVKRTIVPLISTPLAGKLTEAIDKRSAKKAEANKVAE